MSIEDITRRFWRDKNPGAEPPADHEVVRDQRERNSAAALRALREDDKVTLQQRQPAPTDHEIERDRNLWLMSGVAAGAVVAAVGVGAVVHHHREKTAAEEIDDEANA